MAADHTPLDLGRNAMKKITRREAIRRLSGFIGSAFLMNACAFDAEEEMRNSDVTGVIDAIAGTYRRNEILFSSRQPVVSIATIPPKKDLKNGVEYAVREAIDLLGGMGEIAKDKERILIKPNLVSSNPTDTTKPEVIEALVKLMKEAGKNVIIGEGSASTKRNMKWSAVGLVCRTKETDVLNGIQDDVFNALGYDELSRRLRVLLANLHVGDMVRQLIPDNFAFKEIYIHRSLYEADLVCTVPMLKTHGLAGVTLGMKNFIGTYPGQIYGTIRSRVHQIASNVEPSGTASAIVDMVKATNVGLTVIDATTAMEGQGPIEASGGSLVKMDTIVAGTNALATDMVGAKVMGFDPDEIPTFKWAWKAGMKPLRLEDIEVRGKSLESVARLFKRPEIRPYTDVLLWLGPPC